MLDRGWQPCRCHRRRQDVNSPLRLGRKRGGPSADECHLDVPHARQGVLPVVVPIGADWIPSKDSIGHGKVAGRIIDVDQRAIDAAGNHDIAVEVSRGNLSACRAAVVDGLGGQVEGDLERTTHYLDTTDTLIERRDRLW